MSTFLQFFRRGRPSDTVAEPQPIAERMPAMPSPGIAIAPNDPLVAYFLSVPGAVELERLRLESPALEAMRAAGVKVVVPLVSRGELTGVISLRARSAATSTTSSICRMGGWAW